MHAIIQGIEYKIGTHGFTYRWSSEYGEWIRSQMTQAQILSAARKKAESALAAKKASQ